MLGTQAAYRRPDTIPSRAPRALPCAQYTAPKQPATRVFACPKNGNLGHIWGFACLSLTTEIPSAGRITVTPLAKAMM